MPLRAGIPHADGPRANFWVSDAICRRARLNEVRLCVPPGRRSEGVSDGDRVRDLCDCADRCG